MHGPRPSGDDSAVCSIIIVFAVTAAAAATVVDLSVCARIDLTRRVDDDGSGGYNGTVVARAEREWSAAGCGGRHRRRYGGGGGGHHGSNNYRGTCNHTTHIYYCGRTSTDLRSTAVRNKLMGYCQNETLI